MFGDLQGHLLPYPNCTHIERLQQTMCSEKDLDQHLGNYIFVGATQLSWSSWTWKNGILYLEMARSSGLHRKWIQSPGQGHEWMAFWSSPYFNGTIGNSCMFCMSFYLIFLFTCIFPVVQSQQCFWELWLQHPLFQQLSD